MEAFSVSALRYVNSMEYRTAFCKKCPKYLERLKSDPKTKIRELECHPDYYLKTESELQPCLRWRDVEAIEEAANALEDKIFGVLAHPTERSKDGK